MLALTSFLNGAFVQRALQAGSSGYLLKDVHARDLADVIRAAHAGRSTLAAKARQALIQVVAQPAAQTKALSEREQEVLVHMARGLSNGEIATQLSASTRCGIMCEHPGQAGSGESDRGGARGNAAWHTQLLEQIYVLRPDVILISWELWHWLGAELLQILRRLGICPKAIVFGSRPEVQQFVLQSGADAFFSAYDPPETFLTFLQRFGS